MRNESYTFAFYLQANAKLKEETLCKACLQLVLSVFTGATQSSSLGSPTPRKGKWKGRASHFSCCSLTTLILAPLEKEG